MLRRRLVRSSPLLLLMVLLLLAMTCSIGVCGAVEVGIDVEQAKQKVEEAGKETKGGSESWANWAKEKITEGLGIKHVVI
ncbi:hypothetical protein MRB53_028875 [Persea americana]|uniref:Uncharacterized protein n=1 Tax=Persea americana TaxID=3435 RepID=A0ACC2KH51_PERAE|nr:hypothetical protein MRB53_028875 [Persea americana]